MLYEVITDGFNPEFGLKCAQLASQKGIPVVMDCGSWKPQYDEIFNFTDIVIASADFFRITSYNVCYTKLLRTNHNYFCIVIIITNQFYSIKTIHYRHC